MMTSTLALLLAASLAGAAPAPAKTVSQAFSLLANDYWDAQMRLSPTSATFYKYPLYHDRLEEHGAAGREKARTEFQALLGRLHGIRKTGLSRNERVSWEVMDLLLRDSLEWHRHAFWQWDVDHMDGAHSWFPTVIELAQPMQTGGDAEALLRRLGAFPRYFQEQAENIREGLREGKVPVRIPVEKTVRQLDEMLKTPVPKTPIAAATGRLPGGLQREYSPLIARAIEEKVFASYRAYKDFLENEVLPNARPEDRPGILFLPGGAAAYRYMIRHHTTLDLSPEELHRVGKEELASIHAEMDAVARRLGHKGALDSFMDKVRKDPDNFFKTREEVLQDAERLVAQAQAQLPRFFKTLPKTPLVVRPVEDY